MFKISIMIMMVVMASMAMAQPDEDMDIREVAMTFGQVQEQVREQAEMNHTFENSGVIGLEQARLRVQNEEAIQAIESAMERIQEQDKERLNRLENLTFLQGDNESVVAEARSRARFLGLVNVPREVAFNIDEEGEVERLPRALDFLFRYEEDVRNLEGE